MKEFPCTQCGICCKILPRFKPGWPLREDGACKHLGPDNRCTIYATRPRECRINEMHQEVAPQLSPDDYHRATADICNTLQEQFKIDPKFRITLTNGNVQDMPQNIPAASDGSLSGVLPKSQGGGYAKRKVSPRKKGTRRGPV